MSAADNGGPAFPVFEEQYKFYCDDDRMCTKFGGMTLRDYFAAKAMQGAYAGYNGNPPEPERVAEDAYVIADAMIKARQS